MKRGFRAAVSVALSVIIALCFICEGYSGTINSEIFNLNDEIFLARCSGKKVFVAKAAPDYNSYTYTLPTKALDCCVINGTAYILAENNSVKNSADIYTASSGSIKGPVTVYDIKVNNSSKICADKNGTVYIKNASENILIYSKSGKFIKNLSVKAVDLIPFKNYILAYNNKNVYFISNNSAKSVSNPSNTLLYRISENYIADINGKVYRPDNGMSIKAELNHSGFYQLAETKHYFVGCLNNTLTAYNKSDGKVLGKVTTETEIYALCSYKNKIAVISDNNSCSIFSEGQFENNENTAGATSLNLKNYRYSKKYIFINHGTTISDFLGNISYEGFNAEFVHRKSGKLKTGNVVRFTKDNKTIEYTFIVKGDVTGEGNVNSRDETAMFNHLLGIEKLKGIKFLAGDLNRDKKLSNADLVLLSRIIG